MSGLRRKKSNTFTNSQNPARIRAFHALALMRREKVSMAEACRLEHTKPATLLRYAGSAITHDRPGGRFRVAPTDKFIRTLQVPTALGPVPIEIRGSKNATLIAKYQNAVGVYLRTGKESQLRQFKGVRVGPRGKKIELVTDPQTLSVLARAGALHLDSLYASVGAAS